jgi:streptogramin lyase
MFRLAVLVATSFAAFTAAASAGQITQIIDATGDGAGNTLSYPPSMDTDASGNLYVAGGGDVFRVTPAGVITALGGVNTPFGIAVEPDGTVYVTGGVVGENVVQISPAGVETQIVDPFEEDASGNGFEFPNLAAVAPSGKVYFSGGLTSNVFEILAAGGIDQVIDSTGDGTGIVTGCDEFLAGCEWEGNAFLSPNGLIVGPAGNLYVSGRITDNVFQVTPGGVITQIMDASGDGLGNTLDSPGDLALDASGNLFVAGVGSSNVFKIEPGGAITQIIDATGDGLGHALDRASGVAVDSVGNAYVTGYWTSNAFKISPSGVITQIIDSTGDGSGNLLDRPSPIAVDADDNVYVGGYFSHNVFRISPGEAVPAVHLPGRMILVSLLAVMSLRRFRKRLNDVAPFG